MPPTLYHYTCSHGRTRIGNPGELLPGASIAPQARTLPASQYVWLTDMSVPARGPLGLQDRFIPCDRIEFRYRVLDASLAVPWTKVRRTMPEAVRWGLELSEGARPRHWYVSTAPVPVVLDPWHSGS